MAINYNTKIITVANYAITNDDEIIFSNVTGPASITLPSLPSSGAGRTYIVKDYSGNSKINPVTITPPANKLVDGATFAIINTPYGTVWLTYDGLNWKTIAT
jgi:hypothetical protein